MAKQQDKRNLKPDWDERFDPSESNEYELKNAMKRHRLNKYRLNDSLTTLDGMKALAILKNKMQEPLGPVQHVSRYRNNGFVNLQGRVNYTTENTKIVPKFIVYNNKNTIKTIDKIYINHLSCSRRIE